MTGQTSVQVNPAESTTYTLVAEKTPKLPEQMQRRWDRFWGNEQRYERTKKRGERGNDPETDGRRKRGEDD